MSKYEWRKEDKELYLSSKKPTKIFVPELKYFTIEGKGNPNSDSFTDNVEALYALSYTIRMMPKKGVTPNGYFEYTVFPLEGHWDLDEEGRILNYLDKTHFVYKLMIRQPEFVDEDLFQYAAVAAVMQKKSNVDLSRVQYELIAEGLCVQAMHVGSYDDEPATFELMEEYCLQSNLKRAEKTHKEIYLSDPRKTAPEKMKTVLRFKVTEVD